MSGEQDGCSWRTKKHMAAWQTMLAFLPHTIDWGVSGPDIPTTADSTLHPLSPCEAVSSKSPEPMCTPSSCISLRWLSGNFPSYSSQILHGEKACPYHEMVIVIAGVNLCIRLNAMLAMP